MTTTSDSKVTPFVRAWSHMLAIMTCVVIASGLSAGSLLRLLLLLVCFGIVSGLLFNTSDITSNFLTLCFILSVSALTWVLVQSTGRTWLKFLVIGAWVVGALLLRNVRRQCQSATEDRSVLIGLTAAVPIVLVLHGWTNFVPLAVTMSITAALMVMNGTRHRQWLISIVFALNFAAAFAARMWLAREESRVWLTYDQNFRASLASGLMRWGWTDWNAAAGQPVRYHWLSEATAGLLSRLTGVDEFDAVARLLPILGIIAALLAAAALLIHVGVGHTAAWCASGLTIGLNQPFSVYSIGTLWGMSLGFGFIYWLALLHQQPHRDRLKTRHVAGLTLMCVAVLMSQSTVGIAVACAAACSLMLMTIRRRVSVVAVLYVLLSLIVSFQVASSTLLRSEQDTYYSVQRVGPLEHGIIGLPESFKAAFSPWIEPVSQSLLVPMFIASIGVGGLFLGSGGRRTALMLVSSFVAGGLAVLNTVRIGGHEERVVREGIALAMLFGLGGCFGTLRAATKRSVRFCLVGILVVVGVASGIWWQTQRSSAIYLFVHLLIISLVLAAALLRSRGERWISLTAATAALTAGLVLGASHESVRRSYSLSTRTVFSLAEVNGDREIDECLTWIRRNTPAETIVASNMWRIPRGEDQKYFLVSQKTKRRVVIDGPDYVTNVGAFRKRDDLEALKNVVDDFVRTPTVGRLYELRRTEAEYLIVDNRRQRSSRLNTFVAPVVANGACSVFAL